MIHPSAASISFRCPTCGAQLGWPEDATDQTPVTCQECGEEIGTYGDLRDHGLDALRDRLRSHLTQAIKRR